MFGKHLITRDPQIEKMRQDAFEAMELIVKQTMPKIEEIVPQDSIRFVSFEEALKELAEMNKS